MTTTYTLIGKQTVGANGASSVTFSSIPQTYTDLVVKCSTRASGGTAYQDYRITLNGNSTTFKRVFGTGSSSGSDSNANIEAVGNTATASTFSNDEIYIPNYAGSNNKSFSIDNVSENNATEAYAMLIAGILANTAAVTSLALAPTSGNFAQYSTFYLYGISNNTSTQNATVPYASGGDVITTDGTYWYHAFKYSGTFTPLKGLTADVLVVAGGGGGGYRVGGGGGAGGLLGFSSQALTANTGYTCTIGAGGVGGTTGGTGNTGGGTATNGSNSQFASLTASVGGGGGGGLQGNGASGGSGGGSSYYSYSPGSATSGQGYAGGVANAVAGGGGGGATAVGVAGSGNTAGAGGTGSNAYSSWASATSTGVTGYYAGGGGGGTIPGNPAGAGGSGGGGAGSSSSSAPTAGTTNTGGGGGGGQDMQNGANGGSGIIIVRYAV